jgi:hypothetical protein
MHLLLHLKRREEWRGFSFLSAEAEIFPRNVVPPLRFFLMQFTAIALEKMDFRPSVF